MTTNSTLTVGLTDAEIAAQLRERGVPEEAIAAWLKETRKGSGWFERFEAPSFCAECAGGRACQKHSDGTLTTAASVPMPAPKPDRGRTGHKRASTPHRSEASVQREIIQALTNAGWRTWRIGQYNARRTQDAGVPDVYAMRPWAIGYTMPLQCWVECKRSHGGRQSEVQREFQRHCEHAGVRYILARSLDDVRELL